MHEPHPQALSLTHPIPIICRQEALAHWLKLNFIIRTLSSFRPVPAATDSRRSRLHPQPPPPNIHHVPFQIAGSPAAVAPMRALIQHFRPSVVFDLECPGAREEGWREDCRHYADRTGRRREAGSQPCRGLVPESAAPLQGHDRSPF